MSVFKHNELYTVILKITDEQNTCSHVFTFSKALPPFNKSGGSYLCNGAYLLYNRSLHATRLHLLLQEDLLLGLLDDVLSPIGSADHLQDLT